MFYELYGVQLRPMLIVNNDLHGRVDESWTDYDVAQDKLGILQNSQAICLLMSFMLNTLHVQHQHVTFRSIPLESTIEGWEFWLFVNIEQLYYNIIPISFPIDLL